jgi:hypothetical protein
MDSQLGLYKYLDSLSSPWWGGLNNQQNYSSSGTIYIPTKDTRPLVERLSADKLQLQKEKEGYEEYIKKANERILEIDKLLLMCSESPKVVTLFDSLRCLGLL